MCFNRENKNHNLTELYKITYCDNKIKPIYSEIYKNDEIVNVINYDLESKGKTRE